MEVVEYKKQNMFVKIIINRYNKLEKEKVDCCTLMNFYNKQYDNMYNVIFELQDIFDEKSNIIFKTEVIIA